jgi:hypothetical protein
VLTNRLYGEQVAFVTEQVIANVGVDTGRWDVLIKRLPDLAPEHRAAAFGQLELIRPRLSEADRTTIWRALRTELNRQQTFSGMAWALPADELATYAAVTQAFATEDLIERARTLFADTPFGMRDYERAQAELKDQRAAIMRRVIDAHGVDGVLAVAKDTPAPHEVAAATVLVWPELDRLQTIVEPQGVRHFAVERGAQC